jgi:hypothetical protein
LTSNQNFVYFSHPLPSACPVNSTLLLLAYSNGYILYDIYLLNAIGLSPGGSTTVHIYTQTIHRTTQITTETTQITNMEECGPCPVFVSCTLAFALQLRIKHGKPSVRVRKTSVRVRRNSVRVQYTYYQNTHILQNLHTHTHTHTHTYTHTHPHMHIHPHITKQYKSTTVQIKTNTVQDISKLNGHNIIKYAQYKVTLMYIAPLSTGAWGGVVVKALRYLSEGPGIDSQSLGIFSGASDSSMCPQPLKMSTRIFRG